MGFLVGIWREVVGKTIKRHFRLSMVRLKFPFARIRRFSSVRCLDAMGIRSVRTEQQYFNPILVVGLIPTDNLAAISYFRTPLGAQQSKLVPMIRPRILFWTLLAPAAVADHQSNADAASRS